MATILIVDDDPQLRQSFTKILSAEGHKIQTASSGEAGIAAVEKEPPDLVIMDVRMPGITGLEAFQKIHLLDSKLPVIIMTAFGTTETAIEATKMGAFDYVLKPFEIPGILELINKAIKASRFMHAQIQMDAPPKEANQDAIIGSSYAMQEVYKAIGRVAPTDATVLIRGESGTGKELVARALYQHSLRGTMPFLVINCVAIPDTLLESELFGYEKGAFTGAVNRRIGKIEQAHKGTVFLDEIGDMPFSIQAKILRLLQEKSIERLGGKQPIPVDVRIIAATNRDLETAVKEGHFREDLYYRLKVVSLTLPTLRERKEDIPVLTEYFIKQHCKDMNIPNPGISEKAKNELNSHSWPGNVRELSNTIQKALIFCKGGPLDVRDVTQAIDQADLNGGEPNENPTRPDMIIREWLRKQMTNDPPKNLFDDLIDYFGSMIIREALDKTGGNRSHASKLLGLSRPTLLSKIEKYSIKIKADIDFY